MISSADAASVVASADAIGGVAAGATTRRRLRARRRLPHLPAAPARIARAGSARDRRQRPHALRQDARAAGAGSRKLSGSRPRDAYGAPRLGLWGPQGARRSRRTRPSRRSAPGPGARSTQGATSLSRTRRATSAGASCPRRSTCACGRRRASYASTRRTRCAWRTPGGLRRGRGRGRGRRARARLDATLALVAKRLGPDDTARAKRFLDAGDLLEDCALDEAAGAGGARAPSTPRWHSSRSGWAPTNGAREAVLGRG